MQDKKEKVLHLLSIILPISIFVLLAVAIGLTLSAAFRVIQATTEGDEAEDSRRTIIFEGEEIPVSDDAIVDRVPSAKAYLDGLGRGDINNNKRFVDGLRRVYAEQQDLISLEDLTPHDYNIFPHRSMDLNDAMEIFPTEIIIPIDDENVVAVYKLLDGDKVLYAYNSYFYYEEGRTWYTSFLCTVTERISYKDVSSLQVGDTLQDAAELCPAILYQFPVNNYIYILLEEGLLRMDIETDDSRKEPSRWEPEYDAKLAVWMKETSIVDMAFFPIDNTTSEDETSPGSFDRWMGNLPYILLPE